MPMDIDNESSKENKVPKPSATNLEAPHTPRRQVSREEIEKFRAEVINSPFAKKPEPIPVLDDRSKAALAFKRAFLDKLVKFSSEGANEPHIVSQALFKASGDAAACAKILRGEEVCLLPYYYLLRNLVDSVF